MYGHGTHFLVLSGYLDGRTIYPIPVVEFSRTLEGLSGLDLLDFVYRYISILHSVWMIFNRVLLRFEKTVCPDRVAKSRARS